MKNMKKYIVAIALMGFASAAFAQESNSDEVSSTSKTIVYPSEGTISIGVDAVPYVNFIGNIFNGNTDNRLNIGSTDIQGKYFLSDVAAIRVGLSINNYTSTDRSYVIDQSLDVLDAAVQVEDQRIYKSNYFAISAGYQQYMGQGRLRGFYGGALGFSVSRETYDFSWGNEMNTDNTAPVSTGWGNSGSSSARNLTYDYGRESAITFGAFLGAEYFISSMISLSGEVGLYGNYNWSSQGDYTYETVVLGQYEELQQALSPKESSFTLNTQEYSSMAGGRLYFNIYF